MRARVEQCVTLRRKSSRLPAVRLPQMTTYSAGLGGVGQLAAVTIMRLVLAIAAVIIFVIYAAGRVIQQLRRFITHLWPH